MSNYEEIIKILKNFFDHNMDKNIGDLTLGEIVKLADELDNEIYLKLQHSKLYK